MATMLPTPSVRSTCQRTVTAAVFGRPRLTGRGHRASSRQVIQTGVRHGPPTGDSSPLPPSEDRPTRSTPCTSYPSMDRVKSSRSVRHRRRSRQSTGLPMQRHLRTFNGHPARTRRSRTRRLDRPAGSHDFSRVSTVRGGRTIGQTTFGSCRLTARLRLAT